MSKWGFSSPYGGIYDSQSMEDLAFSAYVIHDSILESVIKDIVEYLDSHGFDRSLGVSMTTAEVEEFIPSYQDFTKEELQNGLSLYNIYIE